MKVGRAMTIGFAAGAAGAALVARRNGRGRAYIPLPPGRVATALITGASSGIGAEFARQLAAGGYMPILVARRQNRLEEVADRLARRYGIQSEVLVADLSTDAGVNAVIDRIRDLDDLTVLINNAGFGTRGKLVSADPEKQAAMVRLHALATMQLTQAALPGMVERRRGAIINVSSVAAFLRRPGAVNYCATKAYINAFSEALAQELRGTGVQVQALCPGFTQTEFHDSPEYASKDGGPPARRGPDFIWLSADKVVRESLAALERDQVICVPGLTYQILVGVLRTPIIGPALGRSV